MKEFLQKHCTTIWRSVFTAVLGAVAVSVWNGSLKLGELVIALQPLPAVVQKLEIAVEDLKTRVVILETLRKRDSERGQ